MKKAIEIKKTELDEDNLKDLLSAIGLELKNKCELQLIYSPSFDEELTNSEIWDVAVKLRTSIKEVTKIDEKFSIGDIICFKEEVIRRHQFLEVHSTVQHSHVGSVELTVHPHSDLTEEELQAWHERKARREYEYKLNKQKMKLVPSYFSDNARAVLNFLEYEKHTGESLYKMYELMEGHPTKRNEFQNNLNITKDDFKRFGDAVHNPIVSGELARHAYEDKTKTSNPMTFSEARSFIEHLAKKWLRFKTDEMEVKK